LNEYECLSSKYKCDSNLLLHCHLFSWYNLPSILFAGNGEEILAVDYSKINYKVIVNFD